MYTITPIFFFIFFLFPGVSLLKAQSNDSLIKNVWAKYQAIRREMKNYDTISKEDWDNSAEGGQITGYYKKNILKVIKVFYFGEAGKAETEYYFDDSLLIFFFERRFLYNRPIYWDEKHMKDNNDSVTFDPAKTLVTEDRLYFYKEKLIYWLANKTTKVNLSILANSLYGKSLITNAHKLRIYLRKN